MAKLSSGYTAKKSLILLASLIFLLGNNTAGRVVVKLPCIGRAGGCLMEDGVEEVEMSSEENRRLLWSVTGKRYISYEALRRDAVPCNKPGLPYYSCHASPRANPYNRGCQIISGCRGDSP
ncbi:protein RALF-like 33 [Musa acuminata AAA Group]|uniref:protein RALF-like 33 n=1 Tax=Musa acuminata AAA Group TaxID=214697 RepID=UPI0031CF6961